MQLSGPRNPARTAGTGGGVCSLAYRGQPVEYGFSI